MKAFRLLLPVLVLAGCTTVPVTHTVTSIDGLPAVTDLPDDWRMTGRISLTRGESGWHASVDWAEQIDGFRLRVSGPLGQGGFMLTGSEEGVLLRDAAQQTYQAADADTLLTDVTGWVLPVAGMRYWVRGIPDPDSAFRAEMDDTGRLQRFDQNGWNIRYVRYHVAAAGQWPAVLALVRGDVSVRLVIDQWQLGQPPVPVP